MDYVLAKIIAVAQLAGLDFLVRLVRTWIVNDNSTMTITVVDFDDIGDDDVVFTLQIDNHRCLLYFQILLDDLPYHHHEQSFNNNSILPFQL